MNVSGSMPHFSQASLMGMAIYLRSSPILGRTSRSWKFKSTMSETFISILNRSFLDFVSIIIIGFYGSIYKDNIFIYNFIKLPPVFLWDHGGMPAAFYFAQLFDPAYSIIFYLLMLYINK